MDPEDIIDNWNSLSDIVNDLCSYIDDDVDQDAIVMGMRPTFEEIVNQSASVIDHHTDEEAGQI